jgi:hypothetical protein
MDYTPLPWRQSITAINPDAHITLTPGSIDFGDVPVVSTPEPEQWILILTELTALVAAWLLVNSFFRHRFAAELARQVIVL